MGEAGDVEGGRCGVRRSEVQRIEPAGGGRICNIQITRDKRVALYREERAGGSRPDADVPRVEHGQVSRRSERGGGGRDGEEGVGDRASVHCIDGKK